MRLLFFHMDSELRSRERNALSITPMEVCFHLIDLHQILVSLTTNAAEALGEAGGGVKIATGAGYFDEDSLRHTMGTFIPSPGHYVFLEVTDNGCGMGRETVTRMFDRSQAPAGPIHIRSGMRCLY